ncbi:hypothetical protein [Roseiflexus sp.]
MAARSRRGERVAAPDGLPVIHRKRGATRILGRWCALFALSAPPREPV